MEPTRDIQTGEPHPIGRRCCPVPHQPDPVRCREDMVEAEAIDLFLHGAFLGLFAMDGVFALFSMLLRGRELRQPQGCPQPISLCDVSDRFGGCSMTTSRSRSRSRLRSVPSPTTGRRICRPRILPSPTSSRTRDCCPTGHLSSNALRGWTSRHRAIRLRE